MEVTVNQDKSVFYKKMLTIAIPVVFQHLISISLNLADTIMIGKLGELQLAASGAANQVYSIFLTICFGLLSGGAVYIAQFWGIKKKDKIEKIMGFDLVVGMALALFFFINIQIMPEKIIGIFASDADVITYGTDYIKIVSVSYMLSAVSFAIAFNSRSVEILRVPTIISGFALCLNIALNYVLIYGIGPFPELGIRGAAIATLISRFVEMVLLVSHVVIKKDHPFHCSLRQMFTPDWPLFKRVTKTAIPVVISEGGWSIGVALVFATYGLIGPEALAVVQVSNVTCQIFQSAFFGLGTGAAVIIGESLGKNEKDQAFWYTKSVLKIGWLFAFIMMGLIFASAKPIGSIYNFNAVTMEMLDKSLKIFAITLVPKMIAYVLQCGILRSGGDTLFCMITELASNLCIELALAYVSVVILKWPLHMCIGLASIGNVFKMTVMYLRYRSKKWINTVI